MCHILPLRVLHFCRCGKCHLPLAISHWLFFEPTSQRVTVLMWNQWLMAKGIKMLNSL